jgi:hypothetical protein
VSATLTIQLDHDILAAAEKQASAQNTSLPKIISLQLLIMADNWRDSHSGKTPVTDSLRGTLQLPPDLNWKALIATEIDRKHGDPS